MCHSQQDPSISTPVFVIDFKGRKYSPSLRTQVRTQRQENGKSRKHSTLSPSLDRPSFCILVLASVLKIANYGSSINQRLLFAVPQTIYMNTYLLSTTVLIHVHLPHIRTCKINQHHEQMRSFLGRKVEPLFLLSAS